MDDVLRRNPLFAALDDEQSAELRASMSEVTLARGDSLFHEGDPGDRLYVVTEGKVKVFRGRLGQRADVKKAVVTLEDGHSIDVTTGL